MRALPGDALYQCVDLVDAIRDLCKSHGVDDGVALMACGYIAAYFPAALPPGSQQQNALAWVEAGRSLAEHNASGYRRPRDATVN